MDASHWRAFKLSDEYPKGYLLPEWIPDFFIELSGRKVVWDEVKKQRYLGESVPPETDSSGNSIRRLHKIDPTNNAVQVNGPFPNSALPSFIGQEASIGCDSPQYHGTTAQQHGSSAQQMEFENAHQQPGNVPQQLGRVHQQLGNIPQQLVNPYQFGNAPRPFESIPAQQSVYHSQRLVNPQQFDNAPRPFENTAQRRGDTTHQARRARYSQPQSPPIYFNANVHPIHQNQHQFYTRQQANGRNAQSLIPTLGEDGVIRIGAGLSNFTITGGNFSTVGGQTHYSEGEIRFY
ncbi:hypothetical protein CVT25_003310 [Psilocybe cyanescens]|uniref:Uncharacterized protein n=1 Tax=Psilocybe cyanescens TaxID=93625 RepID=A0A409WMD5_PSICY|nr:hypothetical protein CVT25_003310 [Psilocybe cyanescens]